MTTRRGFLQGLGALLATSALVKPVAAAPAETLTIVSNPALWGDFVKELMGCRVSRYDMAAITRDVLSLSGVDIDTIEIQPQEFYDGFIGEYQGIQFFSDDRTVRRRPV